MDTALTGCSDEGGIIARAKKEINVEEFICGKPPLKVQQ